MSEHQPCSPGSESARERVAAFLLARDEEYAATPHMLAWAGKLIRDCKDAEHDGDCTNKSHTCHRCTADQALGDADKIIALMSIGLAQGPQVPAAWRYQRKEGWEDVWRYVTKPPNDFETLGDWTIQPLYAVPPSPAGEIEQLRTQVAGTKAGRDFHIDTAAELFALLTGVIDAESEFRESMGSNWEGDPLSDAIDAARRFINLEAPALPPPPETTRNLAESICDDCPPVGSIEGTRCLVCPRTSSVPSTEGK